MGELSRFEVVGFRRTAFGVTRDVIAAAVFIDPDRPMRLVTYMLNRQFARWELRLWGPY